MTGRGRRRGSFTVVACAVCSKYFSRFALLKHMRDKHSSEVFECPHCSLKFPDIAALDEHVQDDHIVVTAKLEGDNRPRRARRAPARLRDDKYVCSAKPGTSSTSASAGESTKNIHGGKSVKRQVDGCGFDANSEGTAGSGQNKEGSVDVAVSPDDGPVCPVCAEKTTDFQAMTVHMMSHLDDQKVVFACEDCSAEFDTKAALLEHKSAHDGCGNSTNGRPECAKGSQGYRGKNDGKKKPGKEEVKRRQIKVSTVFCIFCQQAFSGLEALNEHRRAIHSQGPLDFVRSITNPVPSRQRTRPFAKTRPTSEANRPGSEYCCTICGLGPMNYTEVNEHRRTEHQAGPVDACKTVASDTAVQTEVKESQEDVEEASKAGQSRAGCSRIDKINEETWQKIVEKAIEETEDSSDLSCQQCGELFHTEEARKSHGPCLLSCPLCDCICPSKLKLDEHVESCSKTIEVEEEKLDDANDDASAAVKLVEVRERKRKGYDCPVCKAVFTSHRKLELHQKVHPEMRYFCQHCGLIFRTKRGLEHHTVREHGQETDREFPCEFCNKIFNNTITLKSHIAGVHTYQGRYECEICDKKFAFIGRLREHVRSVHIRDAKYKCDQCDDAFVHLNTFKNHMKRHRGEKIVNTRQKISVPTVCPTCGKMLVSQNALRLHQKVHETLDLPCTYCPKKFKNEMYLNSHLKLHTTLPHLKCPYCDRTFRKASVLNEHVVSHTGEKSFFCDTCGFRTGTAGRLKKHKRSQHQNFKYQCWQCPVVVNSSHGLVRHYMQHSQEFPYRCSYCQKLFIIEANAKRHVEFHAKKGTQAQVLNNLFDFYLCPECGKQNRSFANLAVHLYTAHKKTKDELPLPPKSMRQPTFQVVDQIPLQVPESSESQQIIWNNSVECIPIETVGQTIDIDISECGGSDLQMAGFPVTILNTEAGETGVSLPGYVGKDALALAVNQLIGSQTTDQQTVDETISVDLM